MSLKEAEKIRKLYHKENLTQKEIANRMELTQPCISKKMKKYNIDSDYKGFWTEAEENRMKEIYTEKSREQVNEAFPERSWNAIKLKAMDLGLAKPIEEHRKSEEVRQILKENAEKNAVEVGFEKKQKISYILGVVDGDGYTDNSGTLGLEVKNPEFADKFSKKLSSVGLNPGRGQRRGKETVWASSKEFTDWLESFNYDSKFEWLIESGDIWNYIEGAYDSDGNLSNPGPRICSYDEKEKKFIKRLLDYLGLDCKIHTNNVYVRAVNREKFFENVDPVYDRRSP